MILEIDLELKKEFASKGTGGVERIKYIPKPNAKTPKNNDTFVKAFISIFDYHFFYRV